MDRGTNAVNILSGREFPLKLGFIGIANLFQFFDKFTLKKFHREFVAIFFHGNIIFKM